MKLTLNDDGTVTMPLVATPGVSVQSCTLREPSIDELGDIFLWADAANDALPKVRVIPDGLSEQQKVEVAEAALADAKARTRAMYVKGEDGAPPPHADAMVKIVRQLANDLPEGYEIHAGLIPGWACNPRTIDLIVNHFTSPLAGSDQRVKAAVDAIMSTVETP